ncbi:MAG: hypothetical protein DRG71_00490 [Deltaproteobacteria bacterium]|nr:MAG: hypothetical protein DRG71_00490 [Deltaproteobacteria bacterium]
MRDSENPRHKPNCDFCALVDRFKKASNKQELAKVKSELQTCLYPYINRWVNALIQVKRFENSSEEWIKHGLPHDPFRYVDQKIFGPQFDVIIEKFDPEACDYRNTVFLGYIFRTVRTAIMDLARDSKDRPQEIRTEEIDTRLENLTTEKATPGDHFQHLDRLPIEYRVVFKLKFANWMHLDEDEITYLSNKSGWPREKVSQILEDLRNRHSCRGSYQRWEHANYMVGPLYYRLLRQQEKIFELRKVLEGYGVDYRSIRELEAKAKESTQKEALKALKGEKRKNESHVEIVKLEYFLEQVRLMGISKKRLRALKKEASLPPIPSKEISPLLNLTPEGVDTRFFRAKKMLKKINLKDFS